MRSNALFLFALLAACQTPKPITSTPSFVTYPALATRRPNDIAVLPVEDGTKALDATRHLEFMRQTLQRLLVTRRYAPVTTQIVDAALQHSEPGPGETLMTPAYLRRVAGKSTDDAALAVHIDRWDETRLLSEMKVSFQFQAALMASDGTLLWSGNLDGEAKAGGLGPAPRDRDQMARSCAEIALADLLNNLARRSQGQ